MGTQTIAGPTCKLRRQDKHLHMVAWTLIGTPYRVRDTLEGQVSNAVLLDLAISCRPGSHREPGNPREHRLSCAVPRCPATATHHGAGRDARDESILGPSSHGRSGCQRGPIHT